MRNWAPICEGMMTTLSMGEWVGKYYFSGIEKGCASIAPLNTDIIPAFITDVKAFQAKLVSGELQVFVGPLSDNEGNQMLKDGEEFTDTKLQDLGFLMDNVEGTLPK